MALDCALGFGICYACVPCHTEHHGLAVPPSNPLVIGSGGHGRALYCYLGGCMPDYTIVLPGLRLLSTCCPSGSCPNRGWDIDVRPSILVPSMTTRKWPIASLVGKTANLASGCRVSPRGSFRLGGSGLLASDLHDMSATHANVWHGLGHRVARLALAEHGSRT
jgi:hypothetical protein